MEGFKPLEGLCRPDGTFKTPEGFILSPKACNPSAGSGIKILLFRKESLNLE
jgi:hypothetical protein